MATPTHRAAAAALDWSIVLIGYGLFVLVFRLMGGALALHNNINLMAFGGMLALIGLAYGALWTVVGRDSAGMRWTQLQITTFHGGPPDPRQRILRFVGSCLSLCTLVGLLWPLADEESLTWQDHMSGTFPTPIPLSRMRTPGAVVAQAVSRRPGIERFIRIWVPDYLLGDLLEQYHDNYARFGRVRAEGTFIRGCTYSFLAVVWQWLLQISGIDRIASRL